MTFKCSINDDLKREWELLRRGQGLILEEDLEQCELAALQLRERLVNIPYYAERDRQIGMRYWRRLQASDYPIG